MNEDSPNSNGQKKKKKKKVPLTQVPWDTSNNDEYHPSLEGHKRKKIKDAKNSIDVRDNKMRSRGP